MTGSVLDVGGATSYTGTYIGAFIGALLLAGIFTPLVRKLAIRIGAIDQPDGPGGRKVHTRPIARLGGVAIVAAFMIVVLLLVPVSRQLATLLLGAAILAAVGVVDDIRGMRAGPKLAIQIAAAGIVLSGGIGISALTNPLGGYIPLDWGRFAVDIGSIHFHITPIANLLSLLWMVGLVNAINFLDGLDGLAVGVSGIAALALFALAISPGVNQPVVALLAIILAGSAFGFLPFNFYPARIFMGDSGAYFLGMTLAMLAIYSGGKLATLTLVLGFAILDALWAVVRRLRRRQHPFSADREHLHHLLIGAGLPMPIAVTILYLAAAGFGVAALMGNTATKFVAFIILGFTMAAALIVLVRIGRRRAEAAGLGEVAESPLEAAVEKTLK